MKKIMRIMWIIVAFCAILPAFGRQSVTLAWDPSVDTNVTSYVLYYGTASGSYTAQTNTGNSTLATVFDLPAVTWYFVVTARDDNSGLESDPSNEVSCQIPNTPALLGDAYTASPEFTLSRDKGVISGNFSTLPADAKSVYWAKDGLIVASGQILTLDGRMYYGGDGVISVYLVDETTGYWLSPERVVCVDSSYGEYQTELVVFGSSSNAKLFVSCGLLPGSYEFQQIQISAALPAVSPITDLYLRQLLPRQLIGLYSAEWGWNPAPGSDGYVVRTALFRDEIEKGAAGILLSQQLLPAGQTTYRRDIDATLYGGIYVAVSSVVGGQESAPFITWYLPGDIFKTADENIPPLCFQGGIDIDDVNYAYSGYTTARRVPVLTPGQPAGREERTDIDNNTYAGRVSDYGFIRSQYLNRRRME